MSWEHPCPVTLWPHPSHLSELGQDPVSLGIGQENRSGNSNAPAVAEAVCGPGAAWGAPSHSLLGPPNPATLGTARPGAHFTPRWASAVPPAGQSERTSQTPTPSSCGALGTRRGAAADVPTALAQPVHPQVIQGGEALGPTSQKRRLRPEPVCTCPRSHGKARLWVCPPADRDTLGTLQWPSHATRPSSGGRLNPGVYPSSCPHMGA